MKNRFSCLLLLLASLAGCASAPPTAVFPSPEERASALDAMQYGFIPLVVRDACADRHPAPHEANLFDIGQKYADLMTRAELEATWIAPR